MNFSSRLKSLRISHGLSRTVMSGQLLISTSTLAKYESADRTPDIYTLKKLAAFFEVSTDYLLGMGTYCGDHEQNDEYISIIKERTVIYKPTDEEYRLLSDLRSLSFDQYQVIQRQIGIFIDFNKRMNTELSVVKSFPGIDSKVSYR